MASQVTPKKNAAYSFYAALTSQANTNVFQANPTLTTGDVKVSIDGGALQNIATLPVVTPAASKAILVSLSSTEMNADNTQVIFSDAAGSEWADALFNIQTTARQIDDLAFPSTSGRGLDVSATGEAGIDWGNIGSPTATNTLSATTIAVTQVVASVSGAVGSVTGAVGSVGGNVVGSIGSLATQAKADVNAEVVDVVGVDVIADSVPADGSRPTIQQALYMIAQFLTERAVSGLTMTVNKPNGSTTLMTFTLNDAANPTSITRAT
jgi:hypothetical protein